MKEYEIYDSSNGIVLDRVESEREAQREVRKLNRLHNPPTYAYRELRAGR